MAIRFQFGAFGKPVRSFLVLARVEGQPCHVRGDLHRFLCRLGAFFRFLRGRDADGVGLVKLNLQLGLGRLFRDGRLFAP